MNSNDEWIVSSADRTLKSGLKELYIARPVLYALVKRELKSRYRGSLFGFAWALGKPMSMLVIYSLIIGEILGASRSIDFFALYLFVGLMFWGFFAEAVASSSNSLVQSSGLLQKIAFPREIIPLTSVVIAGVNTLIQVPILIAGYAFFNAWPTLSSLVMVPVLITALFLITLTLALLLSALNVYVRDVQPLTELTLTLLMYASPIIYSWTFVYENVLSKFNNSRVFDLYLINPLSTLFIGLQDSLWPGTRTFSSGEVAKDLYSFGSPILWGLLAGSFVASLFAYKIFLKLEPNFAREL
jgi:ABC-2 type transport system permease protein